LAMTLQNGNVNYAVDSYMEKGGRYPLNSGKVQIHFLPEEEKKQSVLREVYSVKKSADKQEREERASAKVIKHIIDTERAGKWFDVESGEEKQVSYKDIAILSRKKQGQISKTVAALAAEGIPVTSVSSVNICEYSEIKTLIDILSLIDNAAQDVPLCSALLSTMGNCTLDDLAEIRLAYKQEKFFRVACQKYADEQTTVTAHKLRAFYKNLQEARVLSGILSAGELLTKIITETRMEARLLAKDNGAACLKRIHRFIEETSVEEPLSVHAFLQRLRNLDYKIPFNENAGEDSVKVLTMHSSKGLEYPIVILDDLSASFRGVDKDEAMIEEKYGLAPRAYHEDKMIRRETLLRRLYEQKQAENSIADELNLYYVALTRAKDTLHLLFKKSTPLPDVKYAKSFTDFTDFSVWEQYIVKDDIFDVPKQERMPLVFNPDEELAKRIMDAFTWQYPHTGYENLPVKSSATQLMDGEFAPEYSPTVAAPLTPDEETETKEYEETGATGKEKGVAYHAFLEYTDFSKLLNGNVRADNEKVKELVDETLARLQKDGTIDVSLLSKETCAKILSGDVFYRLQDKTLYKEQQFLVKLPVKDTYAKYCKEYAALTKDGEEMLFQGAIDLLAVGNDEAWVVDYKYSVKDADGLREKYLPQLALYRQATAKILQLPIEKIHACIVNIYHGFQVDIF
jgi:ATP-dependent helicase/nuclease subunit A